MFTEEEVDALNSLPRDVQMRITGDLLKEMVRLELDVCVFLSGRFTVV